MRKLWVQLALAFGAVTFACVLIIGILVNQQTNTQFRNFIAVNRITNSNLITTLTDYRRENGSWAGVESVFDNFTTPGRGRRQGMMMQMGMLANLILTDDTGHVIVDRRGRHNTNTTLSVDNADAVPIWIDGQITGYVLTDTANDIELTQPDQDYLDHTNQILLRAGVIAGGLSMVVGLLIARGLVAPLDKLTQAARLISRGNLDQQVTARGSEEITTLTRAFNDMAAALKQAEILRRNMVADIAHELRTPLTVIQGSLQAILDDVYPLDKAEIASIYDESLVLKQLVKDLRDLAQAEAGQLSFDIQPMRVTEMIESVAPNFEERCQEKDIAFAVDLPATLPMVEADGLRVRQIFHNLLTNALLHTPTCGSIAVSAAHVTYDLPQSDERGIDGVRIAVTDTGMGISTEDVPHVFDRFWRANKSRSRVQGGSGLGLAIAKQLVEAQGGAIGVESTLDKGSCFWFTLPVISRVIQTRPPDRESALSPV